MISRLLVLGASGDLTGRYLLPALAALGQSGALPEDFELVGGATRDWDDNAFREFAAERLRAHAPDVAEADLDSLLARLRYRVVDVADPASVAEAVAAASGEGVSPVAVYLALPVQLVGPAVAALEAAGLPAASRLVVEKPFGEDLAGAVELNAMIKTVRDAAGDPVDAFRVDHALGMEPLWNMLGMRLNDRMLRTAWNAAHIAQIDILWEETLGLEGRAGYFDGAGMLKDVMQNHMMQLLSIVAMEETADLDELVKGRLQALRAIPTLTTEQAAASSRRGRYTAGRLADDADGGGRSVPSYVDEEGVDPSRQTETFAEVALEIDTPRWRGTRFVLRTGKALAARKKGVLVSFRPGEDGGSDAAGTGTRLWIGIDGPTDVRWEVVGARTPSLDEAMTTTLASPPLELQLPPYARVLRDILTGGSALSVSGDEAEEAWRVFEPVLDAWRRDLVPLQDYPAGSSGPTA